MPTNEPMLFNKQLEKKKNIGRQKCFVWIFLLIGKQTCFAGNFLEKKKISANFDDTFQLWKLTYFSCSLLIIRILSSHVKGALSKFTQLF